MTEPPTEFGLVALVTHARAVPSVERERFVAAATALADDPRAILVHTCHRAEVYAVTQPCGCADGAAMQLPSLPAGGRRLVDRAAARHLVEVAAGLDSVVISEDQILHQLRGCLAGRQTMGIAGGAPLDPLLGRLFQVALRVGREMRSWREGAPRSLADVALDEVELAADVDGTAIARNGDGPLRVRERRTGSATAVRAMSGDAR